MNPSERLKERVALVTGAGQGLGEALARRLAAEGAAVAVADLNGDAAETVAASLREAGARALGVRANVTDEADVAAMVHTVVEGLGGLDILVANAGVLKAHDIQEFPLSDWKLVLDVNPFANFAAGIIGVRAWYSCDVAVRHAASFSAASSIT